MWRFHDSFASWSVAFAEIIIERLQCVVWVARDLLVFNTRQAFWLSRCSFLLRMKSRIDTIWRIRFIRSDVSTRERQKWRKEREKIVRSITSIWTTSYHTSSPNFKVYFGSTFTSRRLRPWKVSYGSVKNTRHRRVDRQTKQTSKDRKEINIFSVISKATYLHIRFICQVEELKQDNDGDAYWKKLKNKQEDSS